MASFTGVTIKLTTWSEIIKILLNIDLENINPTDIAYLQGLVRAEAGNTIERRE